MAKVILTASDGKKITVEGFSRLQVKGDSETRLPTVQWQWEAQVGQPMVYDLILSVPASENFVLEVNGKSVVDITGQFGNVTVALKKGVAAQVIAGTQFWGSAFRMDRFSTLKGAQARPIVF